jgi:pimeloyl-ACP methyl ester carboxylesterase
MSTLTFSAPDGTELAYEVKGEGASDQSPVVCIPGGPMRDPEYLGDLGGLAARRRLIILHLRGTGGSAVPADPTSWRCDRQVADVEALREHLGLERLDLISHSAGGAIAILYAAAHPQRVASLVLVTPSLRALGMTTTDANRDEARLLRTEEPWFAQAYQAAQRIAEDPDGAPDEDWDLIAPFSYGRWDEAARRHDGAARFNEQAAETYFSEGAGDPEATVAGLAALHAPVLILAAEYDAIPRPSVAGAAAGLFPNARVSVLAGAGHYPWIDDPETFVRSIEES